MVKRIPMYVLLVSPNPKYHTTFKRPIIFKLHPILRQVHRMIPKSMKRLPGHRYRVIESIITLVNTLCFVFYKKVMKHEE